MYRFFTVVLLSCSLLLPVYAAEKQEEIPADPWAFELSVQPKKTEAELEAERWTLLMRIHCITMPCILWRQISAHSKRRHFYE